MQRHCMHYDKTPVCLVASVCKPLHCANRKQSLAAVAPSPSRPPQPKRSVPFYVPTLSLFVFLPEVFGNHFPLFSLSLSCPFYSLPDERVFHPWCVLNDSPSAWQ